MNDLAVAVLVPAVLIGLNHLARNPRAEGRGWRVSGKMMRFGVPAVLVGFPLLLGGVELQGNLHYPPLDRTGRLFVDVLMATGIPLFFGGVFTILLSLLLRLWLRFDAYLRKVGPENFARNVGRLGWTVGKSGLKLYGMIFAALAAFHLLGLRNLLFLRALWDGPIFDEPSEPARKDGERTYGAPPAA